ncbi:MAG: response regulator [Candidatus Omnitrophica bacterium]|nr:Sensor histidine kinase RcsC [bacterium]NUN96984.1 response regulator [Candidatus Omnitrophota bacterium]
MTAAAKPRILIVEDDPFSQQVLKKILSEQGFEVVTAENGARALDHLKAGPSFDVILSDWMMPNMDGVELCSRVKEDEALRGTFFILLTSREKTEDKVRALDLGVDDYLTKPCHQEELVARVRAGIRIRSLQSDLINLEKRVAVVQVAATAGHEINNPLTGIFGYLDLLEDSIRSGAAPEALLGYVERISKQATRIRDIVQRLSSLKEVQTKAYVGRQRILDLFPEDSEEKG